MRRYAGQKGIVLLELLLAVGITAMIAAVAGSTIFQMVGVSGRFSDSLKVVHALENAAHWINVDGGRAEEAEEAEVTSDPPTMTLRWEEGDESVTYSLSGTNLQRNHNGKVSTVARYVSSVVFSLSECDTDGCSPDDLEIQVLDGIITDGLITVAMTFSPGGRWGISKDMTLKVWLRPL